MKKLLLLIPLTFLSVPVQPVQSQQVTVYQSCVGEVYFPGYYDQYGNFVQGGVGTTRVPCGGGGGYSRGCNPTAGAAMGAGLAEALSGGNGYRYNSDYSRNRSSGSYNYSYRNYKSNGWSLFGAGLGALMYSC
jgi:hypothetical protein